MTEPKTDKADGTIGKALDVLDLVASIGRPAKFTQLLDASPHPKATLHRLLKTLTRQHMLTYDIESQTYSLGVRLMRLAHSAWQVSSPASIAKPFIKAFLNHFISLMYQFISYFIDWPFALELFCIF